MKPSARQYAVFLFFLSFMLYAQSTDQNRFITNSIGIQMVPVHPGSFRMGSATSSKDCWDERPVHNVAITKPFFISETEITVAQFRQFRKDFVGTGGFEPYAAGIGWYDAVAFCEWLGEKEGKPYRLPTEAEWEYACRAGTDSDFSSGNRMPAPETANAWGLKNMHTGVREWCRDWYGEYPPADQVDPVGPDEGLVRVIRGGSLDNDERNVEKVDYARSANRAGIAPSFGPKKSVQTGSGAGYHSIGFRVVQASLPKANPAAHQTPFARLGVKQMTEPSGIGPDSRKPYFRKRYLLPTPPENRPRKEIDAAGFHPSFRDHNHSPALEVCPNGDVLLIIYTSYSEYEPGVSLVASRLRFGADEWDMPSPMFDFVDVNDHAPLLWNDRGLLRFFWGNPQLDSAYPFQFTGSTDNGATWTEVQFPFFAGAVGPHSRQPINSAFRDANGTLYIPSDGEGNNSVLWASRDNGKSWYDTGGRSAGRHTVYALLKDGRILGIGGKNTDIDGYMPQAVSADGGRTWQVSKTPFASLASNQRPSLLRLKSGRLFFAGDFQKRRTGARPAGVTQTGAFAALSDDDGATWRIKKLPGTQQHEKDTPPWGETLGYSAVRQAPNGMIHLITTMNNPCLHFEMNEAWILDDAGQTLSDAEWMQSKTTAVSGVRRYEEKYPGGKTKMVWNAGIADDGRWLLHGPETWYWENGKMQRQAEYQLGQKIGQETAWDLNGAKQWEWQYGEDGTDVWTQYWPNGQKKAESTWRHFKCEGRAICWDMAGTLQSSVVFVDGKMVE